uniref:Uncharacterized protein n=1 Tax=Cannabis sativa TaxID=3483 RepID=A0A803PL82_CANSA
MISQSPLTSEKGVCIGSNGLRYKMVPRGQNVTFTVHAIGTRGGLAPRTLVWCQVVTRLQEDSLRLQVIPNYRHVILDYRHVVPSYRLQEGDPWLEAGHPNHAVAGKPIATFVVTIAKHINQTLPRSTMMARIKQIVQKSSLSDPRIARLTRMASVEQAWPATKEEDIVRDIKVQEMEDQGEVYPGTPSEDEEEGNEVPSTEKCLAETVINLWEEVVPNLDPSPRRYQNPKVLMGGAQMVLALTFSCAAQFEDSLDYSRAKSMTLKNITTTNNLQKEVDATNKKVFDIRNELGEVNKKLLDANNLVEGQTKEIQAMPSTAQLETDNEALTKEVNDLKDERKGLHTLLSKLTKDKMDLEEDVNSRKMREEELMKEIESLEIIALEVFYEF